MGAVMRYTAQDRKTEHNGRQLVTGISCQPETVYHDLVECKSEGHIEYHLMHSNSVIEPFAGENAFNLAHFTAVFIQLACI